MLCEVLCPVVSGHHRTGLLKGNNTEPDVVRSEQVGRWSLVVNKLVAWLLETVQQSRAQMGQ